MRAWKLRVLRPNTTRLERHVSPGSRCVSGEPGPHNCRIQIMMTFLSVSMFLSLSLPLSRVWTGAVTTLWCVGRWWCPKAFRGNGSLARLIFLNRKSIDLHYLNRNYRLPDSGYNCANTTTRARARAQLCPRVKIYIGWLYALVRRIERNISVCSYFVY